MKTSPWSRLTCACGGTLRLLLLGAAVAMAGCHSFRLNSPGLDKVERTAREPQAAAGPTPPGKYQFRVSQYVFLSDFEVNRDQPLFRELADLREQVYKELHLSGANTVVQVYLFEGQDVYERFMRAKYPDLPKRRAFFVAQPRVGAQEELLVYTSWGDRIQEDLRHELTHALLHSVLKDVPLWLDEGLAEYFEVPPEWKGINYRHLEQIRRGPATAIKPDLARLEQLSQVQQMSPAEYREAWAWVHLMLHDKAEAKTVLTTYLQQLRVNPTPGPLGQRLAGVYPAPNEALAKHLTRLVAAAPSQKAEVPLRIQ
jgi:hypothetical protein